MPLRLTHTSRSARFLTLFLGAACVLAIAYIVGLQIPQDTEGYIIPSTRRQVPWFVIEPQEIEEGVTVPANTHVAFHLPFDFGSIERETLFGNEGKNIRYWGYCFPENFDPDRLSRVQGFPGKFFLSEKERKVREEREHQGKVKFSFIRLPERKQDLESNRIPPIIRHQIESFPAALLCYMMTEQPLAMGLDEDADGLNIKLETENGTDPFSPDTDDDGVWDRIEVASRTSPVTRDSDGDGLIDGLEDRNWNGNVDDGETDPTVRDSDRDGISDYQAFINCKLGKNQYCLK